MIEGQELKKTPDLTSLPESPESIVTRGMGISYPTSNGLLPGISPYFNPYRIPGFDAASLV
jgi:hypothetical protein